MRSAHGLAAYLRAFFALVVATGALFCALGAGRDTPLASADGPAPCTAGGPPDPFHGFCATFGGRNTFYGSYGPGFPSTLGWGFCAENAATGGDYPVPSYGYAPSGAPPGADTASLGALGYAFSQAQANGWWTGGDGAASADDFAAAGKILFDEVVWAQPLPSMGPGLATAFNDLDGWFDQAAGASGSPTLTLGIAGGGTTMSGSAFVQVHVQFPGSNAPVVGLGLLLSVTDGSFDNPAGPTTVGVATDSGGNAVVPVFASGGAPTVTVDSAAGVGQIGIGFYRSANPAAQDLAAFPSPTALTGQLVLTNSAPSGATGTLSVQKAVDDGAYYGPGGAVFDVSSQGVVVATLTTGPTGSAGPTPPLAAGTYVVTEAEPPAGYVAGPAQTVSVTQTANTVVSYTGALTNRIVPATVTIAKLDGHTKTPLDGAVFEVAYDATDNGHYDDVLGECTTAGPTATCSPPGNDGPTLLPGDYQVTEVQAPPGYSLGAATDPVQTVALTPGEHGTVTFTDYLGGLVVEKSGNDTAYHSIAGAAFTAYGPLPSETAVGTMTVPTPPGPTNELYPLEPGTYVVRETSPPAGYQPVTPIVVNVAAGTLEPTVVAVDDPVQPASVAIVKVDAESGAGVGGAVFSVAYAPTPTGAFTETLGTCTTDAEGACAPAGNDGPVGLLPGTYQVTETTPPPGYLFPQDPTEEVTLAPGEVGRVTFADQPLVPVSFEKEATGNVNPTQLVLAGAVIDVTANTAGGPLVATCTTNAEGTCTTAAVLDGGAPYCWREVAAPPGLASGASGCFTASEQTATQPIVVDDSGLFVSVSAQKVDAADPAVGLVGATLDLYRMDGGDGPDQPSPPNGAPAMAGGTWVARVVTGPDGRATFPLQFPGYAYCVVESAAPAGYLPDPSPQCTGVLAGSTTVPAVPNTLDRARRPRVGHPQCLQVQLRDPRHRHPRCDLRPLRGRSPAAGHPAGAGTGSRPRAGRRGRLVRAGDLGRRGEPHLHRARRLRLVPEGGGSAARLPARPRAALHVGAPRVVPRSSHPDRRAPRDSRHRPAERAQVQRAGPPNVDRGGNLRTPRARLAAARAHPDRGTHRGADPLR